MARRVAVIDDDVVFLELMATIVREEVGYEALLLRKAATAFPELVAWRPDAIMLDLLMERPDSGWALLETIRAHPAIRDVPVIVCSVDLRGLLEREEDLRRHRCAVLPKPFQLEELLGILRRVVEPADIA